VKLGGLFVTKLDYKTKYHLSCVWAHKELLEGEKEIWERVAWEYEKAELLATG
jgi:hypothetical protein